MRCSFTRSPKRSIYSNSQNDAGVSFRTLQMSRFGAAGASSHVLAKTFARTMPSGCKPLKGHVAYPAQDERLQPRSEKPDADIQAVRCQQQRYTTSPTPQNVAMTLRASSSA